MSCGRCEAEAKAHGPDGTCPADMDEPKCGTHGIRFMFDGEDHDGKPCVQCVACLLLQNQEMLAVLIALADRVSVRFGEIIKYEPVATGRYLDAAYEVIGKAKTEKRECQHDYKPDPGNVIVECTKCGDVIASG